MNRASKTRGRVIGTRRSTRNTRLNPASEGINVQNNSRSTVSSTDDHASVSESSNSNRRELEFPTDSPNLHVIPAQMLPPAALNTQNGSSLNNSDNHFSRPEICTGFLPLKLAVDLVPRFDGSDSKNTGSLTKFIRQSKIAYSQVRPAEKSNLLSLIRNKIEGHADQLLSSHENPETLDELIRILKSCFARAFEVDYALVELKHLKQKENELVDTYGARASEILSRGLEGAKESYPSLEFVGVRVLLTRSAITGFVTGLRNPTINASVFSTHPDSLNKAIDIASRLERELADRQILFGDETNQIKEFRDNRIHRARITTVSTQNNDRRCYECQQTGHVRVNCPNARQGPRIPRNNNERRQTKQCNYCRKLGHDERDCFSKIRRNQGHNNNKPYNRSNPPLNSKGVPRESATRNTRVIARSNPEGLLSAQI